MESNDTTQWLLLIGAAIASKQIREDAMKKLANEDAPEALKDLWVALRSEVTADIKGAVEKVAGVPSNGVSVMQSIVTSLQERSLARYCERTVTAARFAKGIDADRLLTMLDSMSTNIRARKAAMGKQ